MNHRHATHIGSTASDIALLVIPTDEETIVARATHALTGAAHLPPLRSQTFYEWGNEPVTNQLNSGPI